MLPAKVMRELIVADVRRSPLEGEEVRSVKGMAELYFADADTSIEPSFLYLYTMEIDDTSYLFFRKLTDSSGQSSSA
jgi:hypothetical protein